ncbi:MAG: LuxR family transcriptional regulator [Chloroflexota bacterium]
MNQFDVIQGFLDCAEMDSPPPHRLAAEFLKAVEALGFRHFACCSQVDPFHPPREAVILHNYPRGWVRTFSEAKLYEIDPVLQRAKSSPRPFFWDDAFRSGSLTEPQKLILADAAGYGLTHGYTVPLHLSWLPGNLRASCSVVPDGDRIDTGSYVAIEVLAKYFYFFVSRAFAPWLTPAHIELTPRERQCLVLVAQGKGDWVIGRLLGMGESTAHFHVEQLKRRLGVTTRPQAVAQALMIGQLTFGELARRGDADPVQSDSSPPADLL